MNVELYESIVELFIICPFEIHLVNSLYFIFLCLSNFMSNFT